MKRWQRAMFQCLALLATGASGLASLGTSDCTMGYSITAGRDIVFSAGETERLVEVQASTTDGYWVLDVSASEGTVVEQIDPVPVSDPDDSPPNEATVVRPNRETDTIVFRLSRTETNTDTLRFDAELTGDSCDGPPDLDLRVDVID